MAIERNRGSSRHSHQSHHHHPPPIKPLGEKLKDCCRSTIAFIFSNVGVCGLMVGYTIMGAFLFKEVEGPYEMEDLKYIEKEMEKIDAYREKTVEQLWNITAKYNVLYKVNWTSSVEKIITDYQEEILGAIDNGWDHRNISDGNIQWSFEGGFLYSLTVITTIGYGHISPTSDVGKIMTIFYAIFGLPVFLLYMANMGDILAKSLKWAYSKVCVCKQPEPKYDISVAWRSTAETVLRATAGASGYDPGDIESRDSMKDSMKRDSMKRFGPEESMHRSSLKRYGPDETPIRGPLKRQHELHDGIDTPPDMSDEISLETSSWNRSEKPDVTSVNIPITVSLVIMVALLYGGTKLFQDYENWDILTSFYFCFISLTTIGFGDYVPGSTVIDEKDASGSRARFVYCSLYLMFGLALLSMCFNLMQEEVVHKITKCLKAIKIFKKEPPE